VHFPGMRQRARRALEVTSPTTLRERYDAGCSSTAADQGRLEEAGGRAGDLTVRGKAKFPLFPEQGWRGTSRDLPGGRINRSRVERSPRQDVEADGCDFLQRRRSSASALGRRSPAEGTGRSSSRTVRGPASAVGQGFGRNLHPLAALAFALFPGKEGAKAKRRRFWLSLSFPGKGAGGLGVLLSSQGSVRVRLPVPRFDS